MDYRHFDPSVVEKAPDTAPTKADILHQIEADHYQAKRQNDREAMQVLERRHKKVASAKSDVAARRNYEDAVQEHQRGKPNA